MNPSHYSIIKNSYNIQYMEGIKKINFSILSIALIINRVLENNKVQEGFE